MRVSRRTARPSADRLTPIEPRFALIEPMREGAEATHLVSCLLCEARFTGRWYPDGRPEYEGGLRTARWHRTPNSPAWTWGVALCPCEVGRAMATSGWERVTVLPSSYPCEAAMSWAWATDHEPSAWREAREVRVVNAAELAGWRSRYLRVPEASRAVVPAEGATDPEQAELV